MSPDITPARLRALQVLEHAGGRVTVARSSSFAAGTVSSACASWLIEHGYARTTTGLPGCKLLEWTDEGRMAAADIRLGGGR